MTTYDEQAIASMRSLGCDQSEWAYMRWLLLKDELTRPVGMSYEVFDRICDLLHTYEAMPTVKII